MNDCHSTILQFFYSMPEEIWWFGSEQINKSILKLVVVIKDSSKVVQ